MSAGLGKKNRLSTSLRRVALGGLVGVLAVGAAVVVPASSSSALADNSPLPTVQINGVAWDQVVVGNTVYVTGQFTSARPAGAAKGTNETPRANLLAYDITTGVLNQQWAPSLNAQGVTIAASEDGSRIFVGGDFSQVNGQSRYRLVALDAVSGAVDPNFQAKTDARVRALTVGNGVLYAGGSFNSANNVTRNKAAAFNATDGSLLSWAPVANAPVHSILYAPRGTGRQVVLGGQFTTINGAANAGSASVNPVTGAVNSWPMNKTITNSGAGGGLYISDLATDGRQIYGTGVNHVRGNAGWLEGSFAATLEGSLNWVDGCTGDSYSLFPASDALYKVSHMHDCSGIGDYFTQTSPSAFRRANSWSLDRQPGRLNTTSRFPGQPAPATLNWYPYIPSGKYTGQDQGAWTITGNKAYLAVGGEFEKVSGIGQQGLVRFPLQRAAGTAGQETSISDSFTREVAAGWGSAPDGGKWSVSTANTSVAGEAGQMSLSPGAATVAALRARNFVSADVQYTVTSDVVPTAGSFGSYALGRRTSTGDYRAKVSVAANGSVSLRVLTYVAGTTTTVAQQTVPGITVTAGQPLKVRFAATGAAPTTLQAKVWAADAEEPADWLVDATDATAGLQQEGHVGFIGYNASNSDSPVVLSVDDVQIKGSSAATSTNLALNKPATQSSNFNSVFTAAKAVDGTSTFSHTLSESQPSLTIDLGQIYSLDSITFANRTGCCTERLSDVYVFTSTVPFNGKTVLDSRKQPGVVDRFLPGQVQGSATVSAPGLARYVRIQLKGTNYLTLPEVVVMGRPYGS